MSEIQRISQLFQRAYGGSSWHGPSVRDLLSDVSADEAARRPVPGAHTIWELTRHIVAWQDFVSSALEGGPVEDPPETVNWPPTANVSAEAWREALDELRLSQKRLREAIEAWPPERLDDLVPNKTYPYWQMLYGVVHHDLYHAGQIALLKRAMNDQGA